jgi:putative sterol carrier protein
MAIYFPSDAWVKALGAALNASAGYAQAAKTWEGDFYFVVEAGGPIQKPVYLYMDLWHGKCRDAYEVTDPAQKKPAFTLTAPYEQWKKVILGELDPLKGLVARKLKLQGSSSDMAKIMRAPQAAKELVACCSKIETEFPA